MKLSEINLYPVKGMAGNSVNKAFMELYGLRNDRRLMLVDDVGLFISQRKFPLLSQFRVSNFDNGVSISFGEKMLKIDYSQFRERIPVTIWKSNTQALLADIETNKWLSECLEMSCRLVLMPDTERRLINPRFNRGGEHVSFADGYPIMLIGLASLKDLNQRIEIDLPMNRFRPNLVVKDTDAYAEDVWKRIRIGEVQLRSTKPCSRCVVTTINQDSGAKDGLEPLKTLAKYRRAETIFSKDYLELGLKANDVLFGQNFVVEKSGWISVGDNIQVHES